MLHRRILVGELLATFARTAGQGLVRIAQFAGGLQLLVLSCHPERFRRLPAHVPVVDLVAELDRSRTEA